VRLDEGDGCDNQCRTPPGYHHLNITVNSATAEIARVGGRYVVQGYQGHWC